MKYEYAVVAQHWSALSSLDEIQEHLAELGANGFRLANMVVVPLGNPDDNGSDVIAVMERQVK